MLIPRKKPHCSFAKHRSMNNDSLLIALPIGKRRGWSFAAVNGASWGREITAPIFAPLLISPVTIEALETQVVKGSKTVDLVRNGCPSVLQQRGSSAFSLRSPFCQRLRPRSSSPSFPHEAKLAAGFRKSKGGPNARRRQHADRGVRSSIK